MAELEKAPSAPEPLVKKTYQAISQGLVPGTMPYLEHFGATAKQRGLIPSSHLGPFGRIRDAFSSDAQSLIKEQDTLTALGEGMLQKLSDMQVAQAQAQENAPTAQQAHQQYGIPLQPSQIPYEGPAAPTPRFTPQELQQMPPEQAQEFGADMNPPKMLTLAEQQPPSNTLEPSQLHALQLVQGGHGVFTPQGQYEPMALAKPRPDLIPYTDFINAIKGHEAAGNVEPGTADKLLKVFPGQGAINVRTADAIATEAARRQQERSKQQTTHTLEDTSIAVTGKGFADLSDTATVTPAIQARVKQLVPNTSAKVGDNLKQVIGGLKTLEFPTAVAGTKAAASTQATQATSLVPPDKQSNYIDAKTFADTGRIVYPVSTPDDPFTQAKAATGGWKEITDKQKEAIKSIEIARSTQHTLLDLAHQLIQAKGPGAAFVQGLKTQFGAFIRSNPVAAAFMGDKQAFSSWMSRMVEVGVLTQQDIERWASVLPDQRDTVGSAVAKEAVLNMLFDAAELANRRAIVGDQKGLEAAKKTLSEQIAQAAKLYATGKNRPSAQELYRDEFGK
jgi:hypothetical protein